MNWGKISFQDVDFNQGTGKIIVLDSFETGGFGWLPLRTVW